MTDQEIYNMLSEIEPENYKQWEMLRDCMLKFFINGDAPDFTQDYVDTLTRGDIVDKPVSEIYNKYLEWCRMNYISEYDNVTRFNKYLNYKFGVKTKATNGKRIYVVN